MLVFLQVSLRCYLRCTVYEDPHTMCHELICPRWTRTNPLGLSHVRSIERERRPEDITTSQLYPYEPTSIPRCMVDDLVSIVVQKWAHILWNSRRKKSQIDLKWASDVGLLLIMLPEGWVPLGISWETNAELHSTQSIAPWDAIAQATSIYVSITGRSCRSNVSGAPLHQ